MIIENSDIKEEVTKLAEHILEDLDLSKYPLSNIVLRVSRLARLCGDLEYEKIFDYESSGYPMVQGGKVPPNIWQFLELADRVTKHSDGKDTANLLPILQFETIIETNKQALSVCADPNISTQSSIYFNNSVQRQKLINGILEASSNLASRRTFVYRYVKKKYIELKFSQLTTSVWSSVKDSVDSLVQEFIPDEMQKITVIYDNLNDNNPEKWSLALTSCRRMLKSLADKIYPPSNTPIKKNKNTIQVGEDNFINRLICYIDDNVTSKTSQKITNGNLKFIGERLDAIQEKASKGVHGNVDKDKDEAEKCFMYTYLIIGDILQVVKEKKSDNKDVGIVGEVIDATEKLSK